MSSRSTERPISVQSLLRVAEDLVPVDQLSGQALDRIDRNNIEGAIELSVWRKPILTRENVDDVYLLWIYLVEGLEELAAGRGLSISYPDMPVQIMFRPRHGRVTIKVDTREASVETAPLLGAMLPAGILFFEVLRSFVADADRYIARLGALTRSRPL